MSLLSLASALATAALVSALNNSWSPPAAPLTPNFPPSLPGAPVTLCRSASGCGEASAVCGGTREALGKLDKATVCLGFLRAGAPAESGTKALFKVTVDKFAALSVDNLRTLMGAPWDAKKEGFGEIWVGLKGKRTIGQRRGVLFDGGVCNSTDQDIEPPEGSRICYGWAEHNKALVDENFYLAHGLTVIVHLNFGRVNRIVWDSNCNLCTRAGEIECMWDRSPVACAGNEGYCKDCYAQLQRGKCTDKSAVCAPKVYLAWLGTDKHGAQSPPTQHP